MKWIHLGQNHFSCLDEDVFNQLKDENFGLCGGYAQSTDHSEPRLLHHRVLPRKQGFDIDHKNEDKLDNKMANLRYVTRSENNCNKPNFRGTFFNKTQGKWWAITRENGKIKYLGCCFKTEHDAHLAYLEYCKTKKVHWQNLPTLQPTESQKQEAAKRRLENSRRKKHAVWTKRHKNNFIILDKEGNVYLSKKEASRTLKVPISTIHSWMKKNTLNRLGLRYGTTTIAEHLGT